MFNLNQTAFIALILAMFLNQPSSAVKMVGNRNCICPMQYEPVVCGDSDKQYSNLCKAKCDGVDPDTCRDVGSSAGRTIGKIIRNVASCICPFNYDPVTCEDGVTYSNLCKAQCAKQCLDDDDEEEEEEDFGCDICPAQYDPVTCQDGNTYSNSCRARCDAGQTECVSQGSSAFNIRSNLCTLKCLNFAPTTYCIDNGQSYPSKCAAECNAACEFNPNQQNAFTVNDLDQLVMAPTTNTVAAAQWTVFDLMVILIAFSTLVGSIAICVMMMKSNRYRSQQTVKSLY